MRIVLWDCYVGAHWRVLGISWPVWWLCWAYAGPFGWYHGTLWVSKITASMHL